MKTKLFLLSIILTTPLSASQDVAATGYYLMGLGLTAKAFTLWSGQSDTLPWVGFWTGTTVLTSCALYSCASQKQKIQKNLQDERSRSIEELLPRVNSYFSVIDSITLAQALNMTYIGLTDDQVEANLRKKYVQENAHEIRMRNYLQITKQEALIGSVVSTALFPIIFATTGYYLKKLICDN